MKSSHKIFITIVLVVTLLCISYSYFFPRKEQPHLVLNIPRLEAKGYHDRYTSEYFDSEEFSTFIWHHNGHKYLVWQGFVTNFLISSKYTVNDIFGYYDEKILSLGWESVPNEKCNPYMSELGFEHSYQAYEYPSKYYIQPLACLAVWQDGRWAQILLKTINPSNNVLSDWDL